MKLVRVLRVLLLLPALGAAVGCVRLFPPDEIDPAGNLKRADYLALRQRGDEAKVEPVAPPPIPDMPMPAAPKPRLPGANKKVSITVTETVPLRDVLIELAREAKVNLELDPRVQGGVIFTANNQPFDKVLQRICALAGLRIKVDGSFIRIELDEPYQKTYALDYLSLSRKTVSETSIATNVFDVDVTNGNNGNNGNGNGNRNGTTSTENNSTSRVSATSEADFWSEVDKSLTQILASTGRKTEKQDKNAAQTDFSIDRQSGIVSVFGTTPQHEAVGAYFHKLKRKANAQVLIDARIIEVELEEDFKSGINWRTLFDGAFNAASRFGPAAVGAPFTTAATATNGVFTASVNDRDFAGILNLVKTFGTTRVLSAPRLTVLNNQTAVLKVATNQVYFVTQAQFSPTNIVNGLTVTTTPVYTSTPRTVPVGLVMTVQPAIDADHNRVTMTLRPTISRVVDTVNDPSIGLNAANAGVEDPVQSLIPVLAVREMDSVIRMRSGEVAIMGGLMQDSSQNTDQGIPGFDTLPVIGNLAKSRSNNGKTTELVILLRATIADSPPADAADGELYHHYNNDPRPLPLPSAAKLPPPPPLPTNPS